MSSSEYAALQDDETKGVDGDDQFNWSAVNILLSMAIFGLAGIAEIVGGWLVWSATKGVRSEDESISEKKPWWFALLGSIVLVLYGFIPLLQPSADNDGFARIYAVYGGFFIVMSFLLGWLFEGKAAKPDIGDCVGGAISLIGVLIILFWRR